MAAGARQSPRSAGAPRAARRSIIRAPTIDRHLAHQRPRDHTAPLSRPGDLRLALTLSRELAIPFVPRSRSGIEKILDAADSRFAPVVGELGATLWAKGNPTPLRFHGALGVARARHELRRRPRSASSKRAD
ncbi:MAG TPA: hypothetical protein DFS52_08690 [Myxococcales bacterium]|nr:hypothetical protein [Myxococcales bacterium]